MIVRFIKASNIKEHSPKYIHKPNYNCFHQGCISLLAYNKVGMDESGQYNRSLGLLNSMDLQNCMNLQNSMGLQDIDAGYMSLYIHLEIPPHFRTFSYILHSSEDNTKTITPYLNISYLVYMQTSGNPAIHSFWIGGLYLTFITT
ncbi:hypothetical protein AV654_32985 [Paenibacillus elgii]|uniref:Uncharacterized protein n=1 Tax=Paenibacillus elgii TaxID=189691 RepID=A0A163UCW0_9BACL|nr:hypothetical protein AV654_32985 [Paenibacillus elgii]